MRTLIRREFVVRRPIQETWNHLADVAAWPSWASHIKSATLDPPGPLTAHSKGRFHLVGGVRSTFSMIRFNPPQDWAWKGKFLWLDVEYDHEFEGLGSDQTKLTWTVAAQGFLVQSVGRAYARIYNKNLDRAIPNLIAELEAHSPQGANGAEKERTRDTSLES
jgi:carbon monoxide dehydrogenase subunit G